MAQIQKLIQENQKLKYQLEKFKSFNGLLPYIDDSVIKGGYHVVKDLSERDSIDCCHRKLGMKVLVIGSDLSFKEYILKTNDCKKNIWEEVNVTTKENEVFLIEDYSELSENLTTQKELNLILKQLILNLQTQIDNIELIDEKVQITENTPFAQIGQTQKDFNKNIADGLSTKLDSGKFSPLSPNYLPFLHSSSYFFNSPFYVDTTNYYYVGLNKTNPTEYLDVNGNIKANGFKTHNGTSTQFLMADGSVSILTNPITGTGTTNYIPKFLSSGTVGNSLIYDNGTNVGIGTTSPQAKLDIKAQGALSTDIAFRVKNSTDTRNFLVVNGAGDVYNRGAQGLYSNTFFGENVGRNTTGPYNSAFGFNALGSNTTGNFNSAFGFNALYANTTGTSNSAFGVNAGRYTSNGSHNEISSNSIYLGYDTRSNANNETNQIVIGYNTIGNGSNSVTLGNDSITKTVLKGNVGIGTITPSEKLEVSGSVKATGFKTPNGTANQALTADGGVFDLNEKANIVDIPTKTSFTHDILVANWTLVFGKYEAVISNAGILENSFVDVIPNNDSVDIVIAAQIYPSVLISAGSVKVYSKFLPSDIITVTINII